MTAFHVRQSLRDPRALGCWALAALLAAASGCGKITATQPPDAAPGQPDAGALPDAAPDVIFDATPAPPDAMPGPPDANLGPLVTLKHASSMSVQSVTCLSCMNNTVPQTHADNSWFLVIDPATAGVRGDFQVSRLQVGVQRSIAGGATQPVDVTLHSLPAGAAVTRENLQFVATRTHDVSDVLRQVIELPISGRIPAGSILVAELFAPDGEFDDNLFEMGCNTLGGAGPSYVQARTCQQIVNITSFADLQAGDKHLVMAVLGYDLGAVSDCLATGSRQPPGSRLLPPWGSIHGMEQFFAAGYYHAKALHVIGFVSWFAGLFYIARLYIYDVEADLREPEARRVLQEQLRVMQRRLWYGITWPAMILTFVFGWWMLAPRLLGSMPWESWLLIKLGLVAGLFGYHLMCGRIRKQLVAGTCRWSSQGLRMWNEVATLFLVAIVFDAVLKTLGNVLWGVAGLVLFAIALMIAIRVYRRIREAPDSHAGHAGSASRGA